MREFGHIRRTNDWIRILTLITLVGAVTGLGWALIEYPMQWEDNTKRLNKLEPTVLMDEARISTVETSMKIISVQYEDIKENLNYLRRKADR